MGIPVKKFQEMVEASNRKVAGQFKVDVLTKENYYAAYRYVNSTFLKSLDACEKAAFAEKMGVYQQEEKKAFLQGKLFEAMLTNDADSLARLEQEDGIFKKDGTLYADFSNISTHVERLNKDEFFMRFVNGLYSIPVAGNVNGVLVKSLIDCVMVDENNEVVALVDIKYLKDMKPIWNDETKSKESPLLYWKYDMQAALYQTLVKNVVAEELPFYIAWATKEKTPDYGIALFSSETLATGYQKCVTSLESYQHYMKDTISKDDDGVKRYHIENLDLSKLHGCGACPYCLSQKKLSIEDISII